MYINNASKLITKYFLLRISNRKTNDEEKRNAKFQSGETSENPHLYWEIPKIYLYPKKVLPPVVLVSLNHWIKSKGVNTLVVMNAVRKRKIEASSKWSKSLRGLRLSK